MSPLVARVARAQEWLTAIYRLELELDAASCVVEPEQARDLLPPGSPRTGLVVVEERDEAFVGLYIDPADAADDDAVLEETSHLVCLAWHAAHGRRVSRLHLELQSEVDRYAVARLRGGDAFAHFRGFRFSRGLGGEERRRYGEAHRVGLRTCRTLHLRFPERADTPALLAELRRYYRAAQDAKLRAAA